jgi:exopolysaccharide/PEP-CTERM locus tyrosine autokinase
MSLIEQALERMRQGATTPFGRQPANERPVTVQGKPRPSNWTFARFVEQPPEPAGPDPTVEHKRMVHVDLAALRAAGLLPPESRERLVARQFRSIKLPLVEKASPAGADFEPQASLIMVASALPGEGKTFCAVNLAFSMARERDTEVLIVDADVAKPHVSAAFGVSDEPGLVDALKDDTLDIESLILPTDVDGLRILPAGKFEEDTATELLSSARMKQIVAQLALGRRRRITLFDTPPLLLTTESRVLSTLVGQVVFVVRAGDTPRQAVFDALDSLGEGKLIGVVFNQSTASGKQGEADYYGYGGYGSYGSYGTYGRAADAQTPTAGADR